ncbi:hypothetical protein QF117_11495 [Vibrio sp. YMD68]|uniref:hypothetical protein n=1 Tax=Vibrio sp. YMD68 TaxID=3042300 RepID=UPI002499E743|nr:hypothetical protein [Vibrio sp. YMD68]WGW01404.1 hypothetical protein QF117_11495 [Vibrio sp. YMD68]
MTEITSNTATAAGFLPLAWSFRGIHHRNTDGLGHPCGYCCKLRIYDTSRALAECANRTSLTFGAVLPPLGESKTISRDIAFAVAKQAMQEGLATPISDEALQQRIDSTFWHPEYREYRRTSF